MLACRMGYAHTAINYALSHGLCPYPAHNAYTYKGCARTARNIYYMFTYIYIYIYIYIYMCVDARVDMFLNLFNKLAMHMLAFAMHMLAVQVCEACARISSRGKTRILHCVGERARMVGSRKGSPQT